MTTSNLRVVHVESVPLTEAKSTQSKKKPLHRISTVRQQQGVSVRSAARRMGKDMATIRAQEKESTDLRLSELHEWQQALEVPLVDLIVDPGAPLSRPVLERARLLRLMKTVMAIVERTGETPVRRMAQMLVEQLTEIMPELSEVTPWHAVGQRRSLDEYGRIAENPVPDHYLGQPPHGTDW